jgi:hypothetical protein
MYGKLPWTAGISSSDPVAPLRAKPDSVQPRSSYCREDTCTRSNLAGRPGLIGGYSRIVRICMKKFDSSPGSMSENVGRSGNSDSSPLSQPILTFGMRSRAMLSSYLPDLSTAQNQKRLFDTNHFQHRDSLGDISAFIPKYTIDPLEHAAPSNAFIQKGSWIPDSKLEGPTPCGLACTWKWQNNRTVTTPISETAFSPPLANAPQQPAWNLLGLLANRPTFSRLPTPFSAHPAPASLAKLMTMDPKIFSTCRVTTCRTASPVAARTASPATLAAGGARPGPSAVHRGAAAPPSRHCRRTRNRAGLSRIRARSSTARTARCSRSPPAGPLWPSGSGPSPARRPRSTGPSQPEL